MRVFNEFVQRHFDSCREFHRSLMTSWALSEEQLTGGANGPTGANGQLVGRAALLGSNEEMHQVIDGDYLIVQWSIQS